MPAAVQIDIDWRLPDRRPDGEYVPLAAAPCDDCPNRARCASELLACGSYELFVAGSDIWGRAPRNATRKRYERLFPAAASAARNHPRFTAPSNDC